MGDKAACPISRVSAAAAADHNILTGIRQQALLDFLSSPYVAHAHVTAAITDEDGCVCVCVLLLMVLAFYTRT
jgi:hypothetical protein